MVYRKKWKRLLSAALLALLLAGCGGQSQEEEDVVLTYATMNLDIFMEGHIEEFNQTHERCQIEVREYGEEGYEGGLLRFNADMVSDHPPDIVDIGSLNVLPYLSNGVFTDLYPLMDADPEMKRSDFIPVALKWYETGGKLFALPLGYRIETLIGKEAVVGSPSEWTMEKMQELAGKLPKGSLLIDNLTSVGFLRAALRMGLDQFVDMETGKCRFDSKEFRDLLEMANTMTGANMGKEVEKHLQDGTLLLDRAYIDSLRFYKEAVDRFGGGAVCVGFPSGQGGKSLLVPYKSIAIADRCRHKEEAWEFVSSLLGEEFQEKKLRFNFSVRESSLWKQFQLEFEPPENAQDKDRRASREHAEALYKVINSAAGDSALYSALMPIIEEDAEFYFSGAKTIDQAIEVIQNRVSVYVNTNR